MRRWVAPSRADACLTRSNCHIGGQSIEQRWYLKNPWCQPVSTSPTISFWASIPQRRLVRSSPRKVTSITPSAQLVDLMSKIDQGVQGWEKYNPNGNIYRFIEYRFLSSKSPELCSIRVGGLCWSGRRVSNWHIPHCKIENKARRYGEFEETLKLVGRLNSWASLITRKETDCHFRYSSNYVNR